MDAAAVLEQYVSDISNLPGEIAHVLEEIRDKDLKFYETRKRITQRDNNQLQKFVRTHGSLAENPKEQAAYPKIRADFDKAKALQVEKNDLAITGLYLVAKHLKRLNDKIDALEKEGMIAPEQTGGYEDELDVETYNKVINLVGDDIGLLDNDGEYQGKNSDRQEVMLPSPEMNPLLHAMIEAASQTSGVNGSYLSSVLAGSGGLYGLGGLGQGAGFDGHFSGSSRSGSPAIGAHLRDTKSGHYSGSAAAAQGYLQHHGHRRSSSVRQSRASAAAMANSSSAGNKRHGNSPSVHSRSSTPHMVTGAGGMADALSIASSTPSSSSSSLSNAANALGFGPGGNLKMIPASGKSTAAVAAAAAAAGISNTPDVINSVSGASSGSGANSGVGGSGGSGMLGAGRPTKRQKAAGSLLSAGNSSSNITGAAAGLGVNARSQRHTHNRAGTHSTSRHETPGEEYTQSMSGTSAGTPGGSGFGNAGGSGSGAGNKASSSRRTTNGRFASASRNDDSRGDDQDDDSDNEPVAATKGSRRSDRTKHALAAGNNGNNGNNSNGGNNGAGGNSNTQLHGGPSNKTTVSITNDTSNNTSVITQEAEDEVYCSCRQVSFGNMIACDNDACPYEWFHWDCVGLVEPPQGKWYCPTCTQSMAKETKKRSRS